jgi:BMFP domain-containing protein YqiC
MQSSNRFLNDIAKVASGAASTFVGVKQELDAIVRQRIERLVHDYDLVTREEFEAAKAAARATVEDLERRVAALEARLSEPGDGTAGAGAAEEGTDEAGATGEEPAAS